VIALSRQKVVSSLCGLIVVDKPIGMSSMDVVRRVRRAAGKAKTGHAGTLDPLATGVVICCLGKATKCVEKLMGQPKVYETAVDLSAFTQTDDLEGERQEVGVPVPPTLAQVLAACQLFVGDKIEQTPPIYSAIHINGQRAYKLARRGESIDMPTKIVRIDAIDILDYTWPTLTLSIKCGRGTYIRSLGRDIGKKLNTGGHLAALRRLAVGGYTIEKSHPIDRFESPITQDDLLPVPE
jgi:tRNA pseudouridine55 synthase